MLQRTAFSTLGVLTLAGVASATWSIVVVNAKTGEVCVASATCIGGFDLQPAIAVMRVGQGAAACQSVIDQSGANRMFIWNELQAGITPADILNGLAALDPNHQSRQYGIVSMRSAPVTFTGANDGLAHTGVSGQIGDYQYAIQGNVLAGDIVVQNAEAAFLAATGDTGTRIMAAMEAARAMGGDGRCSCSQLHPTQCGAPPPAPFVSSYTTFICIARIGDTDGVCNASQGCANGHYFCDLRVITLPGDEDPVITLEQHFLTWRGSVGAYADNLLTTVQPNAQSLVADGLSTATVDVQLVNIDGQQVQYTPSQLSVESLTPGTSYAAVGPDVDLTLGHHQFTLTAGTSAGLGRWKITVHQPNQHDVRLWPDLTLRIDPVTELHSGFDALSATAVSNTGGASVPFTLNLGAAHAGESYLVLGTSSGTSPGSIFQGVQIPLNRDRFLATTLHGAGGTSFPNTVGQLDTNGRAECAFVAAPAAAAALVGRHLDWAAIVGSGASAHVTNVAGFDVIP